MGVRFLILVDTHALVWAVGDSKKLSRAAASAIRRARHDGGIAISAITVWEIASLLTRGRVRAYGTLEASIQAFLEDVAVRPITPEICALGALFPDDYSRDPADRIIGGTARAEGLTLITHDERIRRSPLVRTVW
jgi:PIN domain nuclease of toxin-antitoxin system